MEYPEAETVEAMAGGALSADPDRCGTRLKLSEDGNFANAGNAPPIGTYCGFTQEQIKNRSRDGLRESTSQAPPLGLWWGAVVSRICYAAPSSISETLANLQLGVGLTMNAFNKVQAEERQAIIDGELDAQQSTSGGANTSAPESQSSASSSTEGVRVVSEEEAARYRLPPDKIKEALSGVGMADALQVWADQWRGKTSALGIFETPGEFAQQDDALDVTTPDHGLHEVNRRLFNILSQTANQDIMEIETAGARGDKGVVPERLLNLVNQEDRSMGLAIHTAVIQLGSYANCFVIADETMNTLYVNFQLCNVPDHRQDLDLDKGTYSLLCQLAPATWGKRQGGENMVSLAFCALDDQSVFKIIYTMNYMASTYLKWGGDQCGASPQPQEGGAVPPLNKIKNAEKKKKYDELVKIAEDMAKLPAKLAGVKSIDSLERDGERLTPQAAWTDDFQQAACTMQAVLHSVAKSTGGQKVRVTEIAKGFVDSAAKFVQKASVAGREAEAQQWAAELREWIRGLNACGDKVWIGKIPLPHPPGDMLPVPGIAMPPVDDEITQPSSLLDNLSPENNILLPNQAPGSDVGLSSEGSVAESEDTGDTNDDAAQSENDDGDTNGSVESDADRPSPPQLRREMGERQTPPDITPSPPVKTGITDEEAARGEGQSELDTFINLVKAQASIMQKQALNNRANAALRKQEFDTALSKVTEMLESNLGVILNNARTAEVGEAGTQQMKVTDMMARKMVGGAGEKIMEEINSLPDSQNDAKEMARRMQEAFQAFNGYGEALEGDSLTDDQIQAAYDDLREKLDSILAPVEPRQPVNQTVEKGSISCGEAKSSSSDMGDPDEVAKVAKRKVYVTGYSVGGALASLFTLYYSEIRYASPDACGVIPYIPANILPPTTILTTYGAPPCGTNHRNAWDMQSVNRKMQNYIDGGAVVMRRYVTQGDPIPRVVPDDIGRRIGYTHMGNCCGTSVVRCPGTLNIFDGFFETLSNGIAGIASQQMKRGFQLFSTKKYDFQNNEIDEYGCRSWFIDKVDDPSRLKKPEQHADQCGIRFFIPLLALHLGASDGIARERSEEMGPRPLARKQADCSIYLPYDTPDSDGVNTIRRLPLYSGDSPNPGNYCDFMVAATAAPDAQSADMDRVINTNYYDVLRTWGNMDKTGMAELKTKIANAVWGGPMGSVSSGYRYESVYGAVLATINFNQIQGCAYVQAPKGLSGESEMAPGNSVAVAPTTTPVQMKAQKSESRRLGTVGGEKRRTRDKRKKHGRGTRRA